ncbi:MAG: helicase-related protein [Akkermansiaceae bacterium]
MSSSASRLFIVDNSDSDWKVASYLREWCGLSRQIDIATGYFEIGAFLALGEEWSKVDKIRILMGDEVSKRTKRAFDEGLQKINTLLDDSLEQEKRRNDFLAGVPALVEGIRSGRIECRVYRKDKFHAKCYITHARAEVIGSFALVGSSNFTAPGLAQNIELNVQIRGNEVGLLQDWYETHWEDAEDVTSDVLQTFERQIKPRTPFEIWFKALHEYLRARELTPDEWDKTSSKVFPKLARYQRDGYKNMFQIASRFGCAFLCDGVGLGKTFVGLMLIERFVFKEGKRVVLFAPKAAREDVWEVDIERHLPDVSSGFVNLILYNHTDLQRTNPDFQSRLSRTLADADVIIIDEAHHFRNSGVAGSGTKDQSRYRKLQSYIHQSGSRPKQLFFLTATPINNSVHDFRRIIELTTNSDDSYFSRDEKNLGIHSLRRYFVDLDRSLIEHNDTEPEAGLGGIDENLRKECLFEQLVVQRSRAYVRESERLQPSGGPAIIFPDRLPPKVADYRLKATYGQLLDEVETAFDRAAPLFNLNIYNPLAHWIGPADDPILSDFNKQRQIQVVALIRVQFLKRFESSAKAFEMSCYRLLKKLYAWVNANIAEDDEHNLGRLNRWKTRHAKIINFVAAHQLELWEQGENTEPTEDFLTEEELQAAEKLDPLLYDIDKILSLTFEDLEQLASFLDLVARVEPAKDDKLSALKKILKSKELASCKLLLFSEFADTARYLEQQLKDAGITGIERIDGSSPQKRRTDCIRRFAPYYNRKDSAQIAAEGKSEIRILIATDILAEGLNLQDASNLINYDIHWNPVRLMQRIGRVDRRMNPEIEAKLKADHPGVERGKVRYWNFLPPDELDGLLRLYNRVSGKTRMISKTLGVDTGKLLTGNDEFDETRDINKLFDGEQSGIERLRIEYQILLQDFPDVAASLDALPLKVFSGRTHAISPGTRAVFFCYRIPGLDKSLIDASDGTARWSESAGYTLWKLVTPNGEFITTSPDAIADAIRSQPDTPDVRLWEHEDLSKLREIVERQLVNTDLKKLQAPGGVYPILKCWMELS